MIDPGEKRGDQLEFMTAALFQAHGYLVRRSVLLSTSAGTAEATDIDLLAIKFGLPLIEERIVADCKDRKKSKPFERILWTLGLARHARATRAIVVSARPPWQAREFAAQSDIEVLGSEELMKELDTYGGRRRPFGDADVDLNTRYVECISRAGERNRELLRDQVEIRQMLVAGSPLTNFNRVVVFLGRVFRSFKTLDADSSAIRQRAIYEAAIVGSVMLLRFAAEVKWTPDANWADYARKKLTYGDVPPQKAMELARLTFQSEFSSGLPAPTYTSELIELLRILLQRAHLAAILPLAIDFHLNGSVLQSLSEQEAPNALRLVHKEVALIVKQYLSLLAYASGLPTSFWGKEANEGKPTVGPAAKASLSHSVVKPERREGSQLPKGPGSADPQSELPLSEKERRK